MFFSVVFLLLAQCIGKGIRAANLSINSHQSYTQFLLANGVARTPPMGYFFSCFFSS